MKNEPRVKKILYTTDLGEKTRPVFRYATSLAGKYDADIIMLHVVEPISYTALSVIETYLSDNKFETIQKNIMEDTIATMKQRLEKFNQDEGDANNKESIKVNEILVVSGKPSDEILRVAKEYDADIIIMGKSNRKVLGNTVMGSSAKRVSRHANIPVIIIPNAA